MKFQDYYEVLGVPRGAGPDEIKKAYRKLAMEWHPDRHQGASRAEAEKKFRLINEAKEVLTDPEKRAKYDKFGEHWQHGQDFTPPAGGQRRSVSPEEFEAMFGGRGGGFSDFFTSFFGEDMLRGYGGQTTRRRPRKGQDVQAELALSISDAIVGGKREFGLTTEALCQTCGGQGFIDDHVCPACVGVGRTRGTKTIELAIPPELRDGMKLRLRGLGEAGGGEPGDLILTLRLSGDSTWRRQEDDLFADVPVAPWEALDGAKVDLRTLDGTVTLTVPPGTASGARLRLRGLGLKGDIGRGDLFAVIRYALPDNLTDQQKEAIRHMKAGVVKGGARA